MFDLDSLSVSVVNPGVRGMIRFTQNVWVADSKRESELRLSLRAIMMRPDISIERHP